MIGNKAIRAMIVMAVSGVALTGAGLQWVSAELAYWGDGYAMLRARSSSIGGRGLAYASVPRARTASAM